MILISLAFSKCLIFCYARRFDQSSLSPLSLKGIKDAGYEKMTVVQEATLPVLLKGLIPLRHYL